MCRDRCRIGIDITPAFRFRGGAVADEDVRHAQNLHGMLCSMKNEYPVFRVSSWIKIGEPSSDSP
ncbi:MAG: hypothetical protein A2W25_08665 [candidate division Zixibacteria bacterium RBG_16_53_22]|nr:MAG: hypothetical protein A2W25_08665 [candidate division Zixibacteria bacterium RBG_16_53_22]